MKNLYTLIKNLSQSEKRYVKLRLQSTKAASQSILYFDTIAKQKSYCFEELESLDEKSIPVLRSNLDKLYRSILKQLRLFHSDSSNEVKLQGVLTDVKLLQEKGLIKEAKKLNAKLIKYSKEAELFHILKKAVSNHWILLHLSGMLTFEATEELEEDIKYCRKCESEQENLNRLYRRGVSLYYSYFFKEKNPKYIDEIKLILNDPLIGSVKNLLSSSSKMVYFEIKSMCFMVLADIENHHEQRKQQLELLFTAPVFEKDYINKLLVTSNVFTFLKSKSKIKEFGVYLDFFESYFLKIIKKNNSDSVLVEKYYDVFFQNKIFQQHFLRNTDAIIDLVENFKSAVKDKKLVNKLLISRTYLSLSELLVVSDIEKKVIPLLIEYQDWDKSNKSSKSFIDSELVFLVVYWKRGKYDSLDAKLSAFNRYVKQKEVKLDYDQESILSLVSHLHFGTKKQKVEISRLQKPANRIIIESLNKGTPMKEQSSILFKGLSEDYNPKSDKLLQLLFKQG